MHAANRFQHAAWMCKSLEWHSAFGLERDFIANFISRHARAADLIVVSQRTSGSAMARKMVVDPGALVLMAGRPVLVVPPVKDFLAAERIVIAWKDGREARRAVSDSLPLLRRAKQVFVVTVGPESAHQGADDVSAYLTRHEAASLARYSACSRSKRSLARASILARAAAILCSLSSRRASSSGIDRLSGAAD